MASSSTSSPHSNRRSPVVEKKVRIKVLGVGGAGVNAIDRLVLDGFNDVSLLAINTDAQALASSVVTDRLQIGENSTHGLGAGGDPEVGAMAAMEDIQHIRDLMEGHDLIFVATGLGGGTGTGAAPIIARVAREEGALVLALVTLPFTHEGKRRMEIAQKGLAAMQEAADAVICIPNDKLLALAGEKTSVLDAFRPTDEFLSNGVRRIWQILTRTGMINIDFADLRAVLRRKNGETLFGFGEGVGENKAEMALETALSSPLLSDHKILAKATQLLVGVTHGPDFTMGELKKMMEILHDKIGPQTACKQGIVVDENYSDRITMIVIASTGEAVKWEKPHVSAKLIPANKSSEPAPAPADTSKEPAQSRVRKGAPKPTPSSMVKDTSSGMFKEETVAAIEPKKKGGAYEFINDSPRQETLKLDEATRGLFERVERTMLNGEDLDRPTFIRRGIVLKNIQAEKE